MRLVFLILTSFCPIFLFAAQSTEEAFYSSRLVNGMQVYLKPLKLDDDSISIELAVNNGYASFKDYPALTYVISPSTAIESNFTSLFEGYDDSIDLYYSIDAFYSYWIMETDAFHSKTAIEGLHRLLTKPSWNQKGLQNSLMTFNSSEDRDETDKRALFQLNGIPQTVLSPVLLTRTPITLLEVENAYNHLFDNPEKMILVVSGSFNPVSMLKVINESFGMMPQASVATDQKTWPDMNFPHQPKELLQDSVKRDDPLITISFPIPYELNKDTFPLSELVTQSLEESLKHDPSLQIQNISSFNITLELPLYPHLSAAWILIEFQSSNKFFQQETARMVQAVENRFKNGINQQALISAREQIDISDSFWRNEPEYWLAFLGNQALMGFTPEEALKKRKELLNVPLEVVNQKLALFSQNRYTTFISSGKDY